VSPPTHLTGTFGLFGALVGVAVVLALLALWALSSLVKAARARRPLRTLNRLALSTVLALAAAGSAFFGLALHGYDRLTSEVPVARLSFARSGDQQWLAHLRLADGRQLELALAGDEWQLDARVLKWRPYAVIAGLDPVYKIDRLSGRYRDIELERSRSRSAHDLAGDGALDLWQLARAYPKWLPFVDTEYGSGAYLPMREGVEYEVTLSPLGGLVARTVTPATAPAGRD
jgi:hypothetical protein